MVGLLGVVGDALGFAAVLAGVAVVDRGGGSEDCAGIEEWSSLLSSDSVELLGEREIT